MAHHLAEFDSDAIDEILAAAIEEAPPVPPLTSVRPPVAADFAHRRPEPYYPSQRWTGRDD